MRKFLFPALALACVAAALIAFAVWHVTDDEGSQPSPDQSTAEGPSRAINTLRRRATLEKSVTRSEAIARVRILEQSGQLYAAPPTWEPVSDPALGMPYVWFRAEVLTYVKGDDLGTELILRDAGGPDVVYDGTVGPTSGLAVGDEAVVFLLCDGPKPPEGDCGVIDAYIIEGGTARSPWNDKELPSADLMPRVQAALEAAP